MSDSDGIGSPGRQRRSSERSRENIREYVKLLGKKVPDVSPDSKSPISASGEKSPLRGSPSKSSPEEEKKGSPKVRRNLWGCAKSHEKDKEVESIKKESHSLSEKKDEEKGESRASKITLGKDQSAKGNLDNTSAIGEKGTKLQKGERRSSSDSKKTPIKVDKIEESSDDSPPDLVLFLKEGRGRTQNWSEPPTLDAESIATRSRTRVPADLSLQFVKKVKPQDNVKVKGKELKKEIKKEKSKVLETPESLKRLAQSIPLKESRRSSISQENECTKNVTSGKGKTKVASVKECGNSKGKRDDSENSIDEKGKVNTRTRLTRKDSSSSLSDTPGSDLTEDKVGVLKRGQHIKKNVTDGGKAHKENATVNASGEAAKEGAIGVAAKEGSDDDQIVIKKKEEGNGSVKGIDQDEKKSECKIKCAVRSSAGVKMPEEVSSGATLTPMKIKKLTFLPEKKIFEKEPAKIEMKAASETGKISEDKSCKSAEGDVEKGEASKDSGVQEEAEKRAEIRITRRIIKPSSSSEEAVNNQGTVLIPTLPIAERCSVTLESEQEKQAPVKVSNLVTIAAANPGNGAPVRYRKIHIKIPSLQQSQANKIESPIFIGNTEVMTFKGESTSQISQITTKEVKAKQATEEKVLSTPEKTAPHNNSGLSDSDFSLRLSPTPQKVTLYDLTDIEAEEVVVGDGGSSSESSLPGSGKESESSVMMDQVPQQQQSQDLNLLSNEVLDSSSEDDSSKSGEGLSTLKKNLLLSPEGKVALDHSYSSGTSEGSKGSSSTKKKSPVSHEKTLSPRPVYSSASLAKRPLDIMMHNDKINILRQMSQIFNNEKPNEDDDESEEDGKSEGKDLALGVKNRCVPMKGDSSKNRMIKSQSRQLVSIKSSASYVLTPEKSLVKSPSKVLLVEPSPSYVKDLQKDFNNVSNSKNQESQKRDGVKDDQGKSHSKQIKDQDASKKESEVGGVQEMNQKEGKKVEKILEKVTEGVKAKKTIENVKITKDVNSYKKVVSTSIETPGTLKKDIVNQKPQDSCKKSEKHKVVEEASKKNAVNLNKEQSSTKKDTLQSLQQKVLEDNVEKSNKKQEKEDLKESSKEADHSDVPKEDKGMPDKIETAQKSYTNLSDKNSVGKISSCLNNDEKVLCLKEGTEIPKSDEELAPLSSGKSDVVKKIEASSVVPKVFLSPIKGEPFIGFPDKIPKVHHVSSYATSLNENIQVESSTGPKGEAIDIIDGFTFISFNTEEEMMKYSRRGYNKAQKTFRRLRKKKGKARKFSRIKRHSTLVQKSTTSSTAAERPRRETQGHPGERSAEQSSAFASNDLDAFLDNCSRLNISYAIPKCKATEDGVTKITDEFLEEDGKKPSHAEEQNIRPSFPDHATMPQEDQSAVAPQNDDAASDPVQQYEEVNAIDILYPKEKYKYYYNKELCKESKGDGSTLFVHRAGQLVPLTSVFKTQKAAPSVPVSRKTVELIYIYDGGKLLTLGGSLTKINPSNSDSVRARVVLPMGIPCIPKGQIVDSSKKQVKAVEINEDMAKFALSALQEPFCKESDGKDSMPASSQASAVPVEKDCEKSDSKEKEKSEDKKKGKKWPKLPVKPNKSNILDIIAAKLAMSEDESDEKDEAEESKEDDVKMEADKSKSNSPDTIEKDNRDTEEGDKKKDKPQTSEEVSKDIKVPDESSDLKILKEDLEMSSHKDEPVGEGKSTISSALKDEKAEEMDTKEGAGNSKDCKWTNLKAENCNDEVKEEKKNIEVVTKADAEDSKESPLMSDQKEQGGRDEDKEDTSSKDHQESDKTDEANLKDMKVQKEVKDKVASLDEKPPLESEKNEAKEEIEPLKSSDSDTKLSASQSEVSEGIGERKDDESSSDTADSGEKAVNGLTANKSKVFKKNMYRFPSLSREMKRLSMNFVNYVGETIEQPEPVKIDPNATCKNDFCKLGCVCETLLCTRKDPEHCGRIECMFECTCRDESWKHPVSGSGRTMNAVSIFNVDREQMEGLAVREKDFRRTVIQTGSEVILVGAERKKRERRLPDRFKDSAMWSGSDYVTLDTAEVEAPTVKEEYPSIPLHEAAKYIKKCSVKVPWYDIKGISVWCMAHSCYDCKCFTDPSFPASSDEISYMVPLEETSSAETKVSVDQVRVKEEPCLEPSCVVVNIDVNNVQARRRYCWRLKEWYHPVENHSSRTCGYSSSKKRLCEETKQLTITGQSSQENSPEQLVESVVRSLRYEKSKEYSQGGIVLPYYDTFGGVSPAKLKKIVHLQNRNSVEGIKSENSTESVPVVDLTSEIVEESKDSAGFKTQILKPLSKPEDSVRKRSSSFEGKSAMLVKKRRLTEPEDVSETTKLTKIGDVAKKPEPSKNADNIKQTADIISEQDEKTSLVADKELLKKKKEGAESNETVSSARRPLSLVEMMVAEEKRGELELDLSDKTPGNALLVAESRFRKLINMNIIGVIGINKAGRCIISTVDSAMCLRTMTSIHTMISNNALDVGPNMREIFFPAAHAAPRQRFVMIRCDGMKKWEIVGVVQKKGALGFTKKSSEQKNKSSSPQKVAPAQPQVIDLEDEEEQSSTKMNKTDVVELSLKDISPADELESCIERSNGSWEGSFPQIASVQGASDVHIPGAEGLISTDAVDNFEIVSTDVGTGAVEETSSPVTSLPNLIPLTQNPTDQLSVEKPASATDKLPVMASKSPGGNSPTSVVDLEKTNSEKSTSAVSSTVPVASSPQLYFLPTVYSSSTTAVTANFSSSPITSVSGMRMIKLNQSSAKVFGEPSGNSFLPLTPISYQSSQSAVTGAPPLYAASPLLPKLTTTTTSTSSVPSNSSLENVVVCPVSDAKRIGLSSVFRPLDAQKSADHVTPVPTNTQGFQRPLYFAPNPGGMPRMVLMPPHKGVPPQMLSPNTSKNQDVQFKRMLLVPSTTESGRMVLISVPTTVANEPSVSGGEEGTGIVSLSSSSKAPTTDSSVEQGSNSDVQILSTVKPSVLPPPPPLRNMSSAGKREKVTDSTCDDVVILNAPANNTLTISKVESLSQGKVPGSSSSAQVLPTSNSSTRVAATTMVMSSTTISSTLPLLTPSSYTEAISKEKDDGQSLPVKSSSDVSVREKATEKNKAAEPSTSGVSTDNPIIEYETIRSPEKRVKCDEDLKKSPTIKETKKDTVNEGSDDIQELKVTPPQIKKGGHHWSAVDLSLSFKSVKLEWLLGTIRQNVLVNIYRLSLKTQSPVTLSVKNGTSMSTLYGLARKSYFDPVEQKCLPVLILGSVMSAVTSSASTDDSMLFKANAIKYFIRENTGELASYTYDNSGKSLIKLASKKRAATGEMIGIGETISLHSVRDAKYSGSSQTPVKNNDSSKVSQSSDCSCITAGNFICLGHKTADNEKPPVSEASRSQGVCDSLDEKSSSQGSVINSVQPNDQQMKSESSDQKTLSSKSLKQSEPESIPSQAIETSSNIVESSQISKNLENAATLQSSNPDCEIVCVKSSNTQNLAVENKLSTSEWPNTKSKQNDQRAVESEDVIDIEGFCDEDSIITSLRDQMVGLNKMMGLGKSESGFDRPCPLSRKKGKEAVSQMRKSSTLFPAKPKDVDTRQRVPLQLAQVKATDVPDSHTTVDDSHPGPSGVGTSQKQKSSWLGPSVQKLQRREQRIVDIEGTEERSTLVHNELERMRRRALRVLFLNLGNAISHCEKDPSGNCYKAQSKAFILKKASEVAQNLLHQSLKLNKLEMYYRRERSKLIQKLASAIRDKDEDVKKGWKSWVEEHMKNPSAKEVSLTECL
ncbi:uncharacterized protein LOC135226467 isoform X2 [Macrobrachium nipponense]|uniref:uncharacterized protein LOC135226467 isoform X2 n=1 Tax=Macrobrachium nipponense TaxID=159736 RepID=UPI0030C89B15